ncbi:hypothetical protein ACJROX_21945 [Pseudalkalibacillus sp. A8]
MKKEKKELISAPFFDNFFKTVPGTDRKLSVTMAFEKVPGTLKKRIT